jgi:predicted transcriptional regulator
MPTLIELVAGIVSAHASSNELSGEELVQEIERVHATLKALESGQPVEGATAPVEVKPSLTVKQAFKKDEVVCMVCGKGGFKTLTRHIKQAHELKPGQYRKQFNLPSSQSLTAKNYSEDRRQSALDRGLGENLAKARAVRAAKVSTAKAPKIAALTKVLRGVATAKAPAVKAPKEAKPAKVAAVKTSKAAAKTKAPVEAPKVAAPEKVAAKAPTKAKSPGKTQAQATLKEKTPLKAKAPAKAKTTPKK